MTHIYQTNLLVRKEEIIKNVFFESKKHKDIIEIDEASSYSKLSVSVSLSTICNSHLTVNTIKYFVCLRYHAHKHKHKHTPQTV